MPNLITLNRQTPVFGPVQLLKDSYDQKRVLEALQNPINRLLDPYCVQWKNSVRETLQGYLTHGVFTQDGRMDLSRALHETTPHGAMRPDHTPEFFRDVATLEGTNNFIPDTSFNDWITPRKMVNEIESRAEWDARFTFGAMKKIGKVEYGRLAESDRSITNAEYGAGMALSWTWLETNMFNIEFSSFAAKIKYESVELVADEIYTKVQSDFTQTVLSLTGNAQSNVVITAINQADLALRRLENDFERTPYANVRLRILAPPEWQPYLDVLDIVGSQTATAPPRTLKRYPITYSTKLPAGTPGAMVFYVVVDKWEQNELGTRIPLTAYGPEDDINSFASNISYRMAYGTSLDTTSAVKLTFDTTADTFSVYEPQLMRAI